MKKIIIILMLSLVIGGCGNNNSLSFSSEEIEQSIKENEYVIIDVRTKEEYDELHVVDAINIPYDEINEEIEISKDKAIYVYCQSGKRSKQALKALNELGYIVYDLGSIDNIELEKE